MRSAAKVAEKPAAGVAVLQRKCACAGTGECESCRKKPGDQSLQRSAAGPQHPTSAPPVVDRVLNSPGRPLDSPARSYMEPRFGQDFSGVRVHTDRQAAESARAVDAHAYTVGNHIVFDEGKYQPDSHDGRHLLAHELAHTVQQQGLHRSSDSLSLAETSEYHRLEAAANRMAYSALSGSGHKDAMGARPAFPILSRESKKKTATSDKPTPDANPAREWIKADNDLKAVGVQQMAKPVPGAPQDIPVFNMGALELPDKKGDVKKVWNDIAKAGNLQAMVDPGGNTGNPKSALKQERPPTDELKNIWLQKVGWKKENEEDNWKSVATAKDTFRQTATANKNPCQVDHILELQFGGNNVPSNMQMLDGPENMSSGSAIFGDLKSKSVAIRKVLKAKGQTPDFIIMQFDSVTQSTPICKDCCKADDKAKSIKDVKKGESVGGEKGTPYRLIGGGPEADIFITGDEIADKTKGVEISTSKIPENKSAATLIPGFELHELDRSKKSHSVKAGFDPSNKTKLPVTITDKKDIVLSIAKDGKLSLPPKNPHLKFHYPYLSEGEFTKLKLEADNTLSGEGFIKPRLSFLPQFNVKFNKDEFVITAPIPKEKLQKLLPIPGVKITKGELGLKLAPEFRPYGELAFEVARGKKKFLDGKIELSADAQGLVAVGTVDAQIPGLDAAHGEIAYRNEKWSGSINIEAAQLQKLKYVQSGSAFVAFDNNGVQAGGTVVLAIPGTDGVTVSLMYAKQKWLFKGKGSFKPPKLDPVEIEIEYDGDHISGSAETGFKFQGLSGRMKVLYYDEKFSGEGSLTFKKGRAEGKLKVKMSPARKFSGEGEVTIRLSENLVVTGGIAIDEQEKVRLKGVLEFPKPIPLFKPFGDTYKIFEVGISIPIPGASIGGVGLNARIEGALSAGYKIGPGELRHLKLAAAFNPLEEKPDVDVLLTGQFYIGAEAHITGSISGGIEISIGVASVTGLITVSATAMLRGEVISNVELHYQKDRFDAKADFSVMLGLALVLALDATVRAKAGWGWLSVSAEKTWNLASVKYDTGLKLGMKLKKPVMYSSDKGLELPSVNDVEFIKPNISTEDVLRKLFAGNDPPEKEA
ncbi:MAG TPA: DUF4157 domain-containing protein [Bryobacteraceae bacterium]|nr:DUF4157 domain-containing protein [Bryobacteraceae bacterium]